MKRIISNILVAFLMLTGVSVSQAQVTKDVTIETYGISGQGRPTDPSRYYFLQSEGANLAKIKVSTANTGGSINVERVGEFVYFSLAGTDKYLKFTSDNNQVKWLSGKDNNAKWKEVAAIQKAADSKWKSYVLASNESLFLRHRGFVMYANPREENQTFYGDATWKISGGNIIVKPETPNATAYGYKQLQTYAIVNNATNNFFIGINNGGKAGIVDRTKAASGTILSFEIRYKEIMKVAVVVDSKTGKFVTSDAQGNISLTTDEQPGSYWTVVASMQSGLDPTWFSLRSNHPSLKNHYLRHTSLVLFAQAPNTVAAEYFNGDASWKFVDTK